MAEHVQPDETINPHARGHQEDRVNINAIILFTVGLVTVVSIVFLVLAMMMNRFSAARDDLEQRRPALFTLEDPGLYPGPRLQEAPERDMAQMRLEVNRRLGSYGWVDQQEGIAHIPIDRALAIVAEQGLPSRSNDAAGAPE